MRERSFQNFGTALRLHDSRIEAKSLFRNILPVSPCASRFCPDLPISRAGKSFKTKILAELPEKNIGPISPRYATLMFSRTGMPIRLGCFTPVSPRLLPGCKISEQSLTDTSQFRKDPPWQR